jgi:hypothetical protein
MKYNSSSLKRSLHQAKSEGSLFAIRFAKIALLQTPASGMGWNVLTLSGLHASSNREEEGSEVPSDCSSVSAHHDQQTS